MQVQPASLLLDISQVRAGHRERRDGSWYGYSNGDTWGALPFAVDELFRGQTARHVPMIPSIARGLEASDLGEMWRAPVADQARVILRLAQSWWFSTELDRHPIAQHAERQQLDLDPIGLAQHYGIPTGYLDLSDDFDVSAFFATCRATKSGWQPMDEGTGIIYRVSLRELKQDAFEHYLPLGPQSLPRPTEQGAWVAELPMRHAFEGWPEVSMLQFQHDRRVGEHFLEMFAGGSRLFPLDPLADVASEILKCGELPVDLVDAAIQSFASEPQGPRPNQLSAIRAEIFRQVSPIDGRRLLTEEQVSVLLADVEWSAQRLAEVKANWRAVRRIA
jgi:hypothetical protein